MATRISIELAPHSLVMSHTHTQLCHTLTRKGTWLVLALVYWPCIFFCQQNTTGLRDQGVGMALFTSCLRSTQNMLSDLWIRLEPQARISCVLVMDFITLEGSGFIFSCFSLKMTCLAVAMMAITSGMNSFAFEGTLLKRSS